MGVVKIVNYVTKRGFILIISIMLILTNLIPITVGTIVENNEQIYENKINQKNDKEFDLIIKLLMRLGKIPSISLCIINNENFTYKGYGYSKLYARQKPNLDTVYMVASLSKTVTATALLQLYEQGLFDLDHDVNDYLDFEVRNPKYPDVPITFRMLLAHQSSLRGTEDITAYLQLCYLLNVKRYPYPMIREMLVPNGSLYINKIWNDYAPGTEGKYASVSFILLEHLIEVISRQKYTSYCKENIFDPLEMKNTSFHLKDFKRSQLAVSYVDIGPLFIPLPFTEGLYGMGGLKSSIEDFSHYMIAHMNGGVWNGIRILNESTVKLMHSPQFPNNTSGQTKYGLGWFIWNGTDSWGFNPMGHTGCGYGMTANMEMNETYDWGTLFFLNNAIISNKIQRLIFFALLWILIFRTIDNNAGLNRFLYQI